MKGKTWKLKICRAKQRWGKDGVIYRKGTRQFSFLYWWYNNTLQKVVFWERSFSIPDIFKMFLKVYTSSWAHKVVLPGKKTGPTFTQETWVLVWTACYLNSVILGKSLNVCGFLCFLTCLLEALNITHVPSSSLTLWLYFVFHVLVY